MTEESEFVALARRKGGAKVIAYCIALQDDPVASKEAKDNALIIEAQMRERHGDPKPGWLTKEVERQRVYRESLNAISAPWRAEYPQEDGVETQEQFWWRATFSTILTQNGFKLP